MIDAHIDAFRKTGLSAMTGLEEDAQASIANWAQDIVNQYGSILNNYSMKLHSDADLPYPKETVKIAIKTLLTAYVLKEYCYTVYSKLSNLNG